MGKTPKSQGVIKRHERALQKALQDISTGTTIRKAAENARIPKTTLHEAALREFAAGKSTTSRVGVRAAPRQECRGPGRGPDLFPEEEQVVVDLLLFYADRGLPLRRTDVSDAVSVLIARISPARRAKLRFKEGIPGRKFVTGVIARHRSKIKFAKASPQEAVRFAAVNADVLTTHIATLEKLIKDLGVDSKRICNLDESGFSPGRGDVNGTTKRKAFLRSGTRGQKCEPLFQGVDRITLMPTVFADGSLGNLFVVAKGDAIQYRVNKNKNGNEVLETFADCFPRRTVLTTRSELAGVDKHNFLRWAEGFVKEVSDLTKDGRKVLLIFDGYRSHMSVSVLEVLREGGVEVYILPAHTSGATQPLDVSLFSPLGATLNDLIAGVARTDAQVVYGKFEFARFISRAYEMSFTPEKVRNAFRVSGIWPVDGRQLLRVPRPVSHEDRTVLSVEEMSTLLEERRKSVSDGLQLQKVTIRRGWLSTSHGLNVTQAKAMELAKGQERAYALKKAAAAVKMAAKEARAEARRQKPALEIVDALRLRSLAQKRRAKAAGLPLQEYLNRQRSHKERVAAAKMLRAQRRASSYGEGTKSAGAAERVEVGGRQDENDTNRSPRSTNTGQMYDTVHDLGTFS